MTLYNSSDDLIGKFFEHEWEEGKYTGVKYQVEFLSRNELRWRGLEGFPKGRSDTQRYDILRVDNDIYLFSWLADDGLNVSIIYNFNSMRAFGVVSSEKEHHMLSGSLRVVE